MTDLPDDPKLVYCARTKQTGDKVYLIKDGTAAWIKNPETLFALGFGFGDVRMIPHEEFSKFEREEPLDLKEAHSVSLPTSHSDAKTTVEVVTPTSQATEPTLGYREMA